MPTLPQPIRRSLHVLLLTVAAIFLALHWIHLKADFPNYSPWDDWSKYTDEGWYSDAAIRHFQLGHWYLPGDFNPAAALPVWPFLEGIVFLFTGVSLVAVRALTVAVFAGILVASWALITRHSTPPQALAAPAAVLLLAASPFCFAFTRLAILEPLLVLLTLLALLAASSVDKQLAATGSLRQNLLPILTLGLLLPIMVLTKTTALFLTPAIAWMLFARAGYRIGPLLRIGVPVAFLAGALWSAYFFVVVRPHYLADYRYLFSANAYTGITRANAAAVLKATFTDGMWIDPLLYPCAGIAALFALLRPRHLLAHPLIPSLLLWSLGYLAFLAYHDNLQPRYYLVVAVPIILLFPLVIEQFILPLFGRDGRRIAAAVATALVLAIVLPDAAMTIKFVRHPEYTLLNAARQIDDYIAADRRTDPTHSPLVLSISGSDLSLMTGLHSICDDFGTLELTDRVKLYRPGWYVAWNEIDDDKMDAIAPIDRIERVAAFPAMDDPERNLLILYRLDPTTGAPANPHPRRPVPRSLRTKVGQQPSASQLVH